MLTDVSIIADAQEKKLIDLLRKKMKELELVKDELDENSETIIKIMWWCKYACMGYDPELLERLSLCSFITNINFDLIYTRNLEICLYNIGTCKCKCYFDIYNC